MGDPSMCPWGGLEEVSELHYQSKLPALSAQREGLCPGFGAILRNQYPPDRREEPVPPVS